MPVTVWSSSRDLASLAVASNTFSTCAVTCGVTCAMVKPSALASSCNDCFLSRLRPESTCWVTCGDPIAFNPFDVRFANPRFDWLGVQCVNGKSLRADVLVDEPPANLLLQTNREPPTELQDIRIPAPHHFGKCHDGRREHAG